MTIKEMREQKRLSQRALAEHAGVTQAYICALENGTRSNPSVRVVKKIAHELGVSTNRIIEEISKAV